MRRGLLSLVWASLVACGSTASDEKDFCPGDREAAGDRCIARVPACTGRSVPFEGAALDWCDDPGFLTGSAGIGLALLAAISQDPPQWDQLLLVDTPPAEAGRA